MAPGQEPRSDQSSAGTEPEWLHKHVHESNPNPPSADAAFSLAVRAQTERTVTVNDLAQLPQTVLHDCYIVSTGHGTSGPFVFGGVRLVDLMKSYLPPDLEWQWADVVSGDGFGNRVFAGELVGDKRDRPILLATHLDGEPMTRVQGLIRLIVPSETEDALRQVKWIGRIEFH